MTLTTLRPATGRALRVLVVSDALPGHDLGFQKSGHALYVNSILRHFQSRGDDVTLVLFRPKVDFIALSADRLPVRLLGPEMRHACRLIFSVSARAIQTWFAWSLFQRMPSKIQALVDNVRRKIRKAKGGMHHLGTFISPTEIAYVKSCADKLKPDLILYDGIFNAGGRVANCEHWIISHEVKHERTESFAGQGIDVASSAVSEAQEARILQQADKVLAIQWDDAVELRRLAPNADVVVVPATMEITPAQTNPMPIFGRCLFVGSGSFHNFDGIRWFLDECWPLVRKSIPAATLHIYGSVCFRLGAVPMGVVLNGIVDDLSPAYAQAAATIVPLRVGSGLKVKVIEAFAERQAVVTTPVGAQGLLSFQPRPFAMAAADSGFASVLIETLKSEVRQGELRTAAGICAESFRPEIAFQAFDKALASSGRAIN